MIILWFFMFLYYLNIYLYYTDSCVRKSSIEISKTKTSTHNIENHILKSL